MNTIKLKRIYEDYQTSDGYRILVDRLWPRGIKKEDTHIDLWLKEIAPSTELRKWFQHEVKKWPAFSEKYAEEISRNQEATEQLCDILKKENTITLLYGAKDEKHNQAVVLKKWLEQQRARR